MEYERHMSTSPLSTIDKARDGGVGSAGKSVGTPNSVRQISFSGGGSLKEEHDERQKLEKSNFDLKMRVYYLEEALKKFQDTDLGNSDNDELASEVSTLRLDLEEKKIELERRNLLLIKAKGAIETLKNEMERLKSENDGFKDQEDRVHRLKQLNEHVEADYHAQIAELENQLAAARDIASARDRERINAEEKLVRCAALENYLISKA